MTDPTGSTGGHDRGSRYERESTGIPRWVKLTGLIVAVAVVLVVVIMLMGGWGGHGPQRHGGAAAATAPATVAASVRR
jgi:hypothetical protein